MAEKLDIEALLEPIDPDSPCGEGLDEFFFDPAFSALNQLAQGKEEQVMGDEVIPAEEPDWRAIRKTSLEMFDRVHSLRVAVLLTKALCNREGLPGLRDGLELVSAMLDRYWDDVEPLIDEGDATERLNTLAEIAQEQGLIRQVKQVQLVASPAIGKFSVRDYLVATDKLKPLEGQELPTLTVIKQALMDRDLDELTSLIEELDASVKTVESIEATFNGKVAAQYLIDLAPFSKLLAGVRPIVQEVLERRGVAVESSDEGASEEDRAVVRESQVAAGEINSREDVVRMLDRITEYYNRNEPSSPVPLLVQRAKRLVSADFMAIIKDVASDGVKQADLLLGGDDENGN